MDTAGRYERLPSGRHVDARDVADWPKADLPESSDERFDTGQVRRKFGSVARKPLTDMGTASPAPSLRRSRSVWARSGGAVRSAREKSLAGLRVVEAELGSPSY